MVLLPWPPPWRPPSSLLYPVAVRADLQGPWAEDSLRGPPDAVQGIRGSWSSPPVCPAHVSGLGLSSCFPPFSSPGSCLCLWLGEAWAASPTLYPRPVAQLPPATCSPAQSPRGLPRAWESGLCVAGRGSALASVWPLCLLCPCPALGLTGVAESPVLLREAAWCVLHQDHGQCHGPGPLAQQRSQVKVEKGRLASQCHACHVMLLTWSCPHEVGSDLPTPGLRGGA